MDFLDFLWPVIAVTIGVCLLRTYLKGKQFRGKESAKGKVAIVTGANCGIGKQIARELNYRGAKVYLGCRNLDTGKVAVADLAKGGCCSTRLVLLQLDLCSFASIKRFCDDVAAAESKVDILVNNAGVMFYPKFRITEDGHELTWQTNYLGHFLLTGTLMPLMEAVAGEARVLNVSAKAHQYAGPIDLEKIDRRSGWDRLEAYKSSKLAQVMHSRQLSAVLRKRGSNVTINSCHPGICYTHLMRHTPLETIVILRNVCMPFVWFFLKTPKDGAQTPLFCILSKSLNGVSGRYFVEMKQHEPAAVALDDSQCESLYNYSLEACKLDS